MKRMSLLLSLTASSFILLGCGGNDTPPPVPPPAPELGVAYYIDSAIIGTTVICGSTENITDQDGTFQFEYAKVCSFKIGDILLREQGDLTNGQFVLEDNIQVAQFLQSLDNDNDPTNGITITPEVIAYLKAENIIYIPQSDEALKELIEKLKNANIGFGGDFVTKEDAQKHLDNTKKDLEGDISINKPPVARAGDDFSVNDGEVVHLNGSKSSDLDGEIVSYQWVELGNEGNPRDTVKADFAELSVGEHKFKLTVTDDDGAKGDDKVIVTVKANEEATTTLPPIPTDLGLDKPNSLN